MQAVAKKMVLCAVAYEALVKLEWLGSDQRGNELDEIFRYATARVGMIRGFCL